MIQLLLLGFHTDGLLADGDGALRKALSKYGMPQEQLPEIHLCLNHWFRSFKKPLYKLKGATAAGLRGICTEPQIARLGYNINCAARTVLTAVEKEPEDFTPENCVVFRERVLVGPLQHSIGAHDKCDEFHPNLKEVCPTAAQRWCPCQIQAAMREAGCSEAEIDTARKEAEEQCEVPDWWHDCNLAARSDDDDSDYSDYGDEGDPLAGLSATHPDEGCDEQEPQEPQGYLGKCADMPAVVYPKTGAPKDFVAVANAFLCKGLTDENIRALAGGLMTNSN